jgi:hypothetical protein
MNASKHAASPNFGFLAKRYPELERIGALSERYFSDDPIISLITVRQFGELLAQLVAARSYSPMRMNRRLTYCGVSVSMEITRATYWTFFINYA